MHNAKSQFSQVFIEDCFSSSKQLFHHCPYRLIFILSILLCYFGGTKKIIFTCIEIHLICVSYWLNYFHWAFDKNFGIIVLFQVEVNVNGATANACQTLNGVQVCGEYNLSEDFYNTCSIPEGELVLWLLVGII